MAGFSARTAGAAHANPGCSYDLRWGGPCPFGQRTTPPVPRQGPCPLGQGTAPRRVMTLGKQYAPSQPCCALVIWPIFGDFYKTLETVPKSGGKGLLIPSSGRPQPQLDGFHRRLGAIRYREFGEDVLEVPLDRGDGEVQLLGYLAVGLA